MYENKKNNCHDKEQTQKRNTQKCFSPNLKLTIATDEKERPKINSKSHFHQIPKINSDDNPIAIGRTTGFNILSEIFIGGE